MFPNAGVEPIGFLLPSGSSQDTKAVESSCKRFVAQTRFCHSFAAPESAAVVLFSAAEGQGERESSMHLEAYRVDLATFQKSPLWVEVTRVTEWMSKELLSVSLTSSLSMDVQLSQLSGTLH